MTYHEYNQKVVPYVEYEYDIVSDDFLTRLTDMNKAAEKLLSVDKFEVMNYSFRRMFEDMYANYTDLDSKLLGRVPIVLDHYINGFLVKVFIFFAKRNTFSMYILDVSTIENQQIDFKMMSIASISSSLIFGEINNNNMLRLIAGKSDFLEEYDLEESFFDYIVKWIHPHDLPRFKNYNRKFKQKARMGDTYDLTIRFVDPNNHSDIKNYHIFGEVIELNPKTLEYDRLLVVIKDVTDYVVSQERLDLATESTGVAIYEYDIRNELTYVNHSFYTLFGVDPKLLAGNLNIWLDRFDSSSKFLVQDTLARMFSGEKTDIQKRDLLYNHPIRGAIWVQLSANSIFTFNKTVPSKIVGTVLDITERKLNEERLRLIAYYDDLTNVYRRHVLMDQIDMLIHNHDLAILFLDLDKFKEVNDRYGHSVGDRFLKAFVRLIREILLPDYVFGRLAGDEFVIILPNYSEESVKALIENIRKQMSYLKIEDYEHHISVSIGVSYSDKDGDNSSALISVADKNMYEEKAKKWSK